MNTLGLKETIQTRKLDEAIEYVRSALKEGFTNITIKSSDPARRHYFDLFEVCKTKGQF